MQHMPSSNRSAQRRHQYGPRDELTAIASAEIDRLHESLRGCGFALRLIDASGAVKYERTEASRINTEAVAQQSAQCCSVPVHGANGDVIATLDVISQESSAHPAVQSLAELTVLVIEKCLFLQHHMHNTVLHFHERAELVNVLHDGALALADDGTVIGADQTAAKLLEVRDRYELVGRPVTDIFEISGYEHGPIRHMGTSLRVIRDKRRGEYCYGRVLTGSRILEDCESRSPNRHSIELVEVKPSGGALDLTLEELAGEDPQMLRNVRSAYRIADSHVSVLIQGPTGSGKEAFAHAIHRISRRASRRFVAVNCAAIPESLIESELFGYRSGAFTGARKDGMNGRILQSSGGTLFLDEIGDMPLALQTRLLRVLEEQEIVPLGSETAVKVDLHVIAASHRNLREMIARGEFREDLYYRLNGITLELPALAERADKERVIHRVLSAETGNSRPAAIEKSALQTLVAYPWPGNVRELRNVIRTALAICEGGVIRRMDLPREVRMMEPVPVKSHEERAAEEPSNLLKAAERAALLRVIEDCSGNMTRTAEQLGMSRNTLYRKMKTHGIMARRLQQGGWRGSA